MSSQKRFYTSAFTFVLLVLTAAVYASAQAPSVRLPRPSQKATVMQTVGVTDITITYSRPGVKGRKIWGDAPTDAAAANSAATLDDASKRAKDAPIVPYGHVWRTGANEATIFSVTDDVLINGQKLPAGNYSLHTIPGKDEWTIIFNGVADQWGSFNYDEKKDVLRVKAKPQWVKDNQEWLEYSFPAVTPNSAEVLIRWEKVAVPFTVEIPNVDALMRAKIEKVIAANPTDWQIPLQVANQYANNDQWDEALKWIDQSIKVKETFRNLSAKANILIASGKKDEGFAVADQAIARGKADKVDTSRFEKRIADLKAGKM
ncbi:MAG TPA: DUF2911 domain-containing protein [Pyrinomonadaceae bacterium]|nr:DUF2911 domain-containing protein [Pyrinomonadaceae bacterium]